MIEETQKGHISENVNNTYITTTLNDYGVAIFFDYLDDETLTTEAAITDNYVESNYAIQDHIAIKPKIYRLRGCVGEVVYKGSNEWIEALKGIVNNHPILSKTIDKLKPLASISGVIGNYTQSAKNVINQIESSYNRYRKILNSFDPNKTNLLNNRRQQTVVAILNQILQQRLPVNLNKLKFEYNPFTEGQYNKLYYLQSVSSHQGANDFISDIEVTIKEIRVATTKTVALDKEKYGAITTSQIQKQTEVVEGIATGTTVPKTTQDKLMDSFNQTKENFTVKGVCKTAYLFVKNLVEKH